MRAPVRVFIIFSLLLSPFAIADNSDTRQITNLDQLLNIVKQEQQQQRAVHRKREQAFLADKQHQATLLAKARANFQRQQKENQPLLAITEANTAEITRLEQELKAVTDDIGELSSTFREFAGDFSAVLNESLLSVQFPERSSQLKALANSDIQTTIEDIQTLWLILQEDMTAAGKITRFSGQFVDPAGRAHPADILRAGVFTAWSGDEYLRFVPETGELLAPARQPSQRFRRAAKTFGADIQPQVLAIDPTRGNLLGVLGYTPNWRERIAQGGTIGLIIITIGIVGMLWTLYRLAYLWRASSRIRQQLKQVDKPASSNPLGRVLLAVENISLSEDDLLQLKLDEAVLAEIPALERGNSFIKLIAAISPLLGLLGTVTGMILTFQAISLFGTGDPKLMAGGISQALVTTVLGLIVAIPLLFGHALVNHVARTLIQRLDEQCAGVLARNAEQRSQFT